MCSSFKQFERKSSQADTLRFAVAHGKHSPPFLCIMCSLHKLTIVSPCRPRVTRAVGPFVTFRGKLQVQSVCSENTLYIKRYKCSRSVRHFPRKVSTSLLSLPSMVCMSQLNLLQCFMYDVFSLECVFYMIGSLRNVILP